MKQLLFEKGIYEQRRAKLAAAAGSGLILLQGNEDSSMNYTDNCYPFRQDSSFLYYAGLDLPLLTLVIDCQNGKEYLFGKESSIDDIIWMGKQPSLPELAALAGIANTGSHKHLAEFIFKARNGNRAIHILPPYRPENKIKLASLLGTTVAGIDQFVSVDLIKAVVAQREIKEAIEIEQIEASVNISVDMHLAAMQVARPGMKEYEIAAAVEAVALAKNARLSYPIILTINGQTLHNHYHGNTVNEGDMMLVDAGAENAMHYAGDLTRTFPVSKAFTTQQRDVYNIVNHSLEHAAAMLKPGVAFKDVHLEASIKLLEGLRSLNIVKGDATEAAMAGAHTLFFQCGLGHMMGLDVHDMEDLGEPYVGYTDTLLKRKDFGWKSLRLGKALKEGFVLTVEPGIYIIPELIDRWVADKHLEQFINYSELEHWRNFGGIRIENNYLVTAAGSQMFGKKLAQTVEEVEAIRSSVL